MPWLASPPHHPADKNVFLTCSQTNNNIVDVFPLRPHPHGNLVKVFSTPIRAFAAGNAPAATLVFIEFHGAQCELNHAGRVVEHHDATPDPSIEPAFATESKSMATVDLFSGSTGV